MGDPAYRPNVGIALFNAAGRVFLARRIGDDGPEVIYPGFEWQMPQGGVESGEDWEAAARRELAEETGVTNASLLAMLTRQVTYDWPPYHGPPHQLTAWRGQVQTWFAFRFGGDESEIDLTCAASGESAEFDQWRWEDLSRTPDLVVPYKREAYAAVAAEFARFARPA